MKSVLASLVTFIVIAVVLSSQAVVSNLTPSSDLIATTLKRERVLEPMKATAPGIILAHDVMDTERNKTKPQSSLTNWNSECVECTGAADPYSSPFLPSLALDKFEQGRISYYGNGLNYAYKADSIWITQTLDAVEPRGNTSLALDALGYPHLAYYDYNTLKYTYWTGSTWISQTIDAEADGIGGGISLALDDMGYPYIAYYFSSRNCLNFAHWTGSIWLTQTVDTSEGAGPGVSLALDKWRRPHISYSDVYRGILKYAQWTGNTWTVEPVDSDVEYGGWATSLKLDSKNYPHIGYFRQNRVAYSVLNYAHWTGSAWQIEAVDDGVGGSSVALKLNVADHPRMAYGLDSSIKYAVREQNWDIQTVENEAYNASLALDNEGHPHIAYSEYPEYNLKYAQAMPYPILEKQAMPYSNLHIGDIVTYTLTLSGPGLQVRLWDPLPKPLAYISDSITNSIVPLAIYSSSAKAIIWEGTLPTQTVQVVRFQVVLTDDAGTSSSLMPIVNTGWLTDTISGANTQGFSIINGWYAYLPVVLREMQ